MKYAETTRQLFDHISPAPISTSDYMLICSGHGFVAVDSLRAGPADPRDAHAVLEHLHALAKTETATSKKES